MGNDHQVSRFELPCFRGRASLFWPARPFFDPYYTFQEESPTPSRQSQAKTSCLRLPRAIGLRLQRFGCRVCLGFELSRLKLDIDSLLLETTAERGVPTPEFTTRAAAQR